MGDVLRVSYESEEGDHTFRSQRASLVASLAPMALDEPEGCTPCVAPVRSDAFFNIVCTNPADLQAHNVKYGSGGFQAWSTREISLQF